MANKHRGFIEVELDKTRTLRYTLNALAEVEDRIGVPLEELENVKMTIKNVRILLWAGLIHEDPDLTPEEVGNMVDMGNFQEVQEKVALAFTGGSKNE